MAKKKRRRSGGRRRQSRRSSTTQTVRGVITAKSVKQMPLIVKGGLALSALAAATKVSDIGIDPVAALENKQYVNFLKAAADNLKRLNTYYPALGAIGLVVVAKKV